MNCNSKSVLNSPQLILSEFMLIKVRKIHLK